jgi:tetratricopeptide (TPR) repeat protein
VDAPYPPIADDARQLYREGSVAEAHALYRRIDRLYPFPSLASLGHAGENWIEDARQDLRECQLYLDAETAYQGAEWQAAVSRYEALWLTSPPLELRDTAQAHQAEALVRWARALEAEGQRERALDRYRFVRDENLGRGRQIDGQPIQVHRAIGDLYLDWGDELLAQDPEAALATYRRALADTDDPGVWARAEGRMVDAYCAWNAQLHQAGQDDRAAGVCIELGNEFPALVPDPCAACAP